MDSNINKQDLIAYLSHTCDCELEKPLEEIDEELVDSCVNLSLKLQYKEFRHTTEEIQENVNKIPFDKSAEPDNTTEKKARRRINAKKALFIAALITILYAILTASIGYSESPDGDFIKQASESIGIENIEFGKEYKFNGISYIEHEYLERYHDIKDYPKDNPHNVLFPTYLPEDLKLESLYVTDKLEEGIEICVCCNITDASYSISLDSKLPDSITDFATETVKVNEKTVYIVYIPEAQMYQMYFEYSGDYYTMSYHDKQELLKIIASMEE